MSEEIGSGLTRRLFLKSSGITGIAVASAPLLARAKGQDEATSTHKPFVPDGAQSIELNINGETKRVTVESRVTLLDCIRENLQMTGTKKGCDHGQCGACTVHVNGQRINSCLSFAVMHQGDKITTIEGLGTPEKLHPMQKAIVDHDGFQCGYCTPGQIMSAVALMKEPCGKADQDVRECMSGNICRCGAYKNILNAIQEVRGLRGTKA